MEIFSKTGGTDLDVRRREIILFIGFIYFGIPYIFLGEVGCWYEVECCLVGGHGFTDSYERCLGLCGKC
jgi:hypothetical protein